MNLFGVFTTEGGNLMALFRNKLDALEFIAHCAELGIPLEVEELNAWDAMKMWN